MIGADLEGLGLSHDESDLGGLLVLEQLDGARAPLLPLAAVLVKSVQLRFPADTSTEPEASDLDQHRERSDRARSSGSGGSGALHVEEDVLVLFAGGDGDLLELHDGGDLGASVLFLARRRGLLLLAVLRQVGHGWSSGSRAWGLRSLCSTVARRCGSGGGQGREERRGERK